MKEKHEEEKYPHRSTDDKRKQLQWNAESRGRDKQLSFIAREPRMFVAESEARNITDRSIEDKRETRDPVQSIDSLEQDSSDTGIH